MAFTLNFACLFVCRIVFRGLVLVYKWMELFLASLFVCGIVSSSFMLVYK